MIVKCENCNTRIDTDYADNGTLLCDDCFYDEYFCCVCCEKDLPNDEYAQEGECKKCCIEWQLDRLEEDRINSEIDRMRGK